jgi:phosphopantetheine--protein transferase-like protein
MRIGCDIVCIPEFKKRAERGGEGFFKKVFLPSELRNASAEHLAGIFAAKEAIVKTLDMSPGSWLDIEIESYSSGKPHCRMVTDLSISHEKDYVIAIAYRNF